jgi:hypothetical protein
MKTLHGRILGLAFLAFLFLTSTNAIAQASNFVGNWESATPVVIMNNSVMRIKILATSNPNVLIIINRDNPTKKIIAKYEPTNGRISATVKNTPIYFVYVSSTDGLECYKTSTQALICNLIRN